MLGDAVCDVDYVKAAQVITNWKIELLDHDKRVPLGEHTGSRRTQGTCSVQL